MPLAVFVNNNNTDVTKPKNDSVFVIDELINHFIDPTYEWFATTTAKSVNLNGKKVAAILDAKNIDEIIGNEATYYITDEKGNVVPQNWRIFICGTISTSGSTKYISNCKIYWGSNLQIPDSLINNNSIVALPENSVPFVTLWDETTYPSLEKSFFNYAMTLTKRGFALSTWRNYQSNTIVPSTLDEVTPKTGNVILCIQRPVLPETGKVKVPPAPPENYMGKMPVMALSMEGNSSPGREGRLSIVRERDINASSPMRDISEPGLYALYGINLNWTHPNILANNTHIIKVPYGLCTDRHLYPEELDLISFTQATSFITYQEAKINMYNADRYYTGTWGEVEYNYENKEGRREILGGTRICLLSNGPEFQ